MTDAIPNRCPVCGAPAPLHAVHLEARESGRQSGTRDVVYMCPNCHAEFDRGTLRGLEFEVVLADLMAASGQFASVAMNGSLPAFGGNSYEADIVAKTKDGKQTVIVECKVAQTLGTSRLRDTLNQLKRFKYVSGEIQLVFAVPARLTAEQRAIASDSGIEVWDLDGIVARFRDVLDGVTHPVLRPLLFAAAALGEAHSQSPESRLLHELRSIEPGRAKWSVYQRLITRILERLFCPPLSSPIQNSADEPDVNRRDLILPNYATGGFWMFVRERYAADFIVVDAKNYTDNISKIEALQVLNYLKLHGAGHLGLIITRKGADEACMLTIKEHWSHSQKMLVVLSDNHVERMLRAKETNGPPEDVIRQWIEDFRLSM